MNSIVFGVYFLYIIFVVIYALCLTNRRKRAHRKYVYRGIASVLERYNEENIDNVIFEIESIYNTCCRFYKDLYQIYPNIVFVFDDIHAVINTKYRTRIISKKELEIFDNKYIIFENIHSILKEKYPYYEYSEEQQYVLKELGENPNLLDRMMVEFRTENLKQEKNEKETRKSIMIGLIGVILSAIGILLQG